MSQGSARCVLSLISQGVKNIYILVFCKGNQWGPRLQRSMSSTFAPLKSRCLCQNLQHAKYPGCEMSLSPATFLVSSSEPSVAAGCCSKIEVKWWNHCEWRGTKAANTSRHNGGSSAGAEERWKTHAVWEMSIWALLFQVIGLKGLFHMEVEKPH